MARGNAGAALAISPLVQITRITALNFKVKMNVAAEQAIFQRFYAHNPEPVTELNYTSAYELLVAVILSAQATDAAVNRATAVLFARVNTPAGMAALGQEQLEGYIKSIGLYHNKAKNIIAASTLLMSRFNGQVPKSRADLESLPGVGRKTANVILNTLFQEPTIAVDTHVFRVARRLGLASGTTVLAVEKQLMNSVPPEYLPRAHHWLVLHGRYICRARTPECGVCFLHDLCRNSVFKRQNVV